MKKTVSWVLITVGIVIFGFLIVQIFSVYIYREKNSSMIEGNIRPDFLSSGMQEDSVLYEKGLQHTMTMRVLRYRKQALLIS